MSYEYSNNKDKLIITIGDKSFVLQYDAYIKRYSYEIENDKVSFLLYLKPIGGCNWLTYYKFNDQEYEEDGIDYEEPDITFENGMRHAHDTLIKRYKLLQETGFEF